MPAGLDGNPQPISSPERRAVIDEVVREALSVRPKDRPLLVGVDGHSGTGKSTFGDEVSAALAAHGLTVVRSTTDSFHNDRQTRRRLGPHSPQGYYRESFNLQRLRSELLDPVRTASGVYCVAVFDEPTDTQVEVEHFDVDPSMVLVFDGLFLHRPELRNYWDVSVLLEAEARGMTESVAWAERVNGSNGAALFVWLAWWWSIARRYIEGRRIYEAECAPGELATFIVDNNDFAQPTIRRARNS